MNLPLVSKNTVGSTVRSAQELSQENDGFVLEFSRHVGKINPEIVFFIKKWMKYFSSPTDSVRAAMGMLMIYKLLESQAEANELNGQEFKDY